MKCFFPFPYSQLSRYFNSKCLRAYGHNGPHRRFDLTWEGTKIIKEKIKQPSKYFTHPAVFTFYRARSRCNSSKNDAYRWYGGKGIKFLLTKKEVLLAWDRDNAANMIHPTIDRKNSMGDYVFDNIRFIEHHHNLERMNEDRGKNRFLKELKDLK